MDKMISRCGLDCLACPAYKATMNDSDEERTQVAKIWSEEYGGELKAEDINCLGCTKVDGPHIGHWDVCEMRICSTKKGLETCGHCDEMESCDIIGGLFKVVPVAKENLVELRKSL